MTENNLKTLKDMDEFIDFEQRIRLRIEAVKWYKERTCTKDDWILFFDLNWEDLK